MTSWIIATCLTFWIGMGTIIAIVLYNDGLPAVYSLMMLFAWPLGLGISILEWIMCNIFKRHDWSDWKMIEPDLWSRHCKRCRLLEDREFDSEERKWK